ncbi:hypothetical protein KIPB_015264, partial [Kipferlia bialata]|eukprot:g15264.t1
MPKCPLCIHGKKYPLTKLGDEATFKRVVGFLMGSEGNPPTLEEFTQA